MAVADIDVQRLVHERLRNNSYAASMTDQDFLLVPVEVTVRQADDLLRPIARTPFVPTGLDERRPRCEEVLGV